MESRQRSPTPLLKTCRTCAHAKIKCDRTQDSVICDRCLRLGKECSYAPARGRKPPGSRARSNKLLHVPDQSAPPPAESPAASSSNHSRSPPPATPSSGLPRPRLEGHDPFDAGQLTVEKGQELLDRFRTKLTPHFPFVIISADENVNTLKQTKPALCLALMAAASHDDVRLQRALGQMFNELIAARLIEGDFTSLHILQGLLVHLAWAHFQPRPKRYTQHLHLAVSIVSDLRLDRPKNVQGWNVERSERMGTAQHYVESLDEQRAFLGTYYLSSCSSIVLQKLRIVTLTTYMTETADRLAEVAEYPTDQYLPYIIRLQRVAEDIDDVVKNESTLDPMQIQAAVSDARERIHLFKNNLSFPLGDCPILVPQMHTIQLCLNQLSLPDAPFALHKPQNPSSQRLIQGLSESIVSAKSLVSILLHTPPGQEVYFPNIVWVMLHCGNTLAARLDLQAADPRISFMTEHLRQFSDIGHTIRQVVLRLESATSPDVDDRGDRDSFYHFLIRTKRVEKWYLDQQKLFTSQHDVSPQGLNVPTARSLSSLGTPTSNLSSQSVGFDYSVAPSVFSQPAIASASNAMAYTDFTLPENAAMTSNADFPVDSLAFVNDTFIPFKGWNYAMGSDHGGSAQF
ncbi:unnamed protein product [Colletotrichum noveboracense]|uniref:Zn(2)-C6 fungal-type domain-containing protein n=1 Tax=Colletotrichum noveboracense TaxID=2664923 RepID=A0A9W4RLG7_9PEZI|nr:hypothetical protein K456DRAFT_55229 [Colletotrichum gloeosporioides 23]CAI0643518.1 unnamed protein product [Colletotrichum noveboracense]